MPMESGITTLILESLVLLGPIVDLHKGVLEVHDVEGVVDVAKLVAGTVVRSSSSRAHLVFRNGL